jgi:molecular chaperone GrpE (heat shock protein)
MASQSASGPRTQQRKRTGLMVTAQLQSNSSGWCNDMLTLLGCWRMQDKFLRLNAEFENFRKRSSKEKADAINKAKSNVIQVRTLWTSCAFAARRETVAWACCEVVKW